MIYTINYNDKELSGRVLLKGKRSQILNEYRLMTRIIMDRFGADQVLAWTAGLAHDDISKITIELGIQPETGGEYIPKEVKQIDGRS